MPWESESIDWTAWPFCLVWCFLLEFFSCFLLLFCFPQVLNSNFFSWQKKCSCKGSRVPLNYFRFWAIGALTTSLLEMAGIDMTSAGLQRSEDRFKVYYQQLLSEDVRLIPHNYHSVKTVCFTIHFCKSSSRNLETISAVIYTRYVCKTQAKMNFTNVVDDYIFSTQSKPEAQKCNCVHSFKSNNFYALVMD